MARLCIGCHRGQGGDGGRARGEGREADDNCLRRASCVCVPRSSPAPLRIRISLLRGFSSDRLP